jgi:hypothetical protein
MAINQWDLKYTIPARPVLAIDRGLRVIRQAVAGLAPVLLLYVAYTLVRWAVADRGPAHGPEHAARLLRLEDALHIDLERSVQSFGLRHDWLVTAANWYYVAAFLPVLVLAAALAAWRAPAAFLRWRNVFAVSLGMALVGFALFPLSPPRLMPADHGYVDTLTTYGPQYYGDEHGSSLFNGFGRLPSTVNEYAAMPSMHVAWSAVAGILLAIVIGRRWAWGFAVAHPLAMAFTVVVTANHYVMDVLGGLFVLGLAIGSVAIFPWIATLRARLAVNPTAPALIQTCANASCGD